METAAVQCRRYVTVRLMVQKRIRPFKLSIALQA
jgi:hypothetical protein